MILFLLYVIFVKEYLGLLNKSWKKEILWYCMGRTPTNNCYEHIIRETQGGLTSI